MRRINRCHFTKDDGELCGSPAMRGQSYCYFHLEVIRRRRRLAQKAKAKRELAAAIAYEEEISRLKSYGEKILAGLTSVTPAETRLCEEQGEGVQQRANIGSQAVKSSVGSCS